MDLGLRGAALQSVFVEYTVSLRLSGEYFIVIESPFEVDLDGTRVSLSPGDESDETRLVLDQLVGDTIEEAAADAAGALHMTFKRGARLTVEADAEYEAWTVSGPDGALVVSTPGGDLSVWKPKSTAPSSLPDISTYVDLIDRFIRQESSASAFEKSFLQSMKAESRILSDPVYALLQELFEDADAYVDSDELRTAPEDLDDAQLLASALRTRDALRELGYA